ncbi:neutral zinc metallopeptidase [Kribbella sp. C-35]|uniref:neutral zinc metallopeptidase n=1 Tax=Kribbella sp. C-35 TaxID=2789276 RepID=UPI00397E281D
MPSKAPVTPTYNQRGQKQLVRNKIYSAGEVPAVACVLPDVALRSQKAVQQYLNAFQGCLQRAWKPVVVRAGVKFRTSAVYAVREGSKTACGTFAKKDHAYYCPEDSGIYFDWAELVDWEEYGHVAAQLYTQVTMAHEFGHHVQQLVGISTYYDDRWGEVTGAAHLEPMRRHELQASCFGSAFLGANQTSLDLYGARYEAYRSEASYGDHPPATERDHGSPQSNAEWASAAFGAESPAACNTWVAPAEWVS